MRDRPKTPISVRFARHVHFCDSGCWAWTGAKNENGYGVIGRGRRGEGNAKAHRLSFEIFHAVQLNPQQVICHRCDNPACVNPDHLFVGTQQDNLADMVSKERGSTPPLLRGTENPKAKLNEHLVRRAFRLREDGLSTYRIADELGVSRPAICSVLNKKTWRHVDVRTSNHIS